MSIYTHIRVSEILAQFRDLSKINPDILRTKGEIGTEVHSNIHMHNCGIWPIFDKYPSYDRHARVTGWSDRGEGYFESYMQYDRKERPRYSHMEKRFFDDNLMITGQCDGIRVIDGALPVISDFKCSYTADEELWSMQAHYYKHLTTVNGIETADYFEWLQLNKDGKMPNIYRFDYCHRMMSRCIAEAEMIWERKRDAKCVA